MQKTLSFKNSQLSYSDFGNGPVLVLLHGFLENSTMWSAVIPELSKTNRVIAIDLLGHGKTGCLGYVHSMELMAEAVYAILKSLRIRRVKLVGHSLGGYVSLAFAELYPLVIKELCLMNSTADEDSFERKELRTRANKMAQTNYQNMVNMSIANLFQPKSLESFSTEVKQVKKEALTTPLQGYLAAQEGMKARPNRAHVLQKNSFPCLYIVGKNDPILNSKEVLQEAEQNNAEVLVLEGGHMSHIENKEEIIIALRKFAKDQ
ncbi:MAG: alpha/beta hydrolase [Flavobacteriaceae bacterium]|nr:alpha/beta hydrolase [Flavobacteriaceae bacterium]